MGRDLYGEITPSLVSAYSSSHVTQSCVTGQYVQHERSQVVMTSWCILSLIYAQHPDKSIVERAARLIMSRQKKDGRWEPEDTEGIFNKNCAIDYTGEWIVPNHRPAADVVGAFKFIFTIWALGTADEYLKS